jgi:hypothetical protein
LRNCAENVKLSLRSDSDSDSDVHALVRTIALSMFGSFSYKAYKTKTKPKTLPFRPCRTVCTTTRSTVATFQTTRIMMKSLRRARESFQRVLTHAASKGHVGTQMHCTCERAFLRSLPQMGVFERTAEVAELDVLVYVLAILCVLLLF